jgi:hypothetical protein
MNIASDAGYTRVIDRLRQILRAFGMGCYFDQIDKVWVLV